MRLLDILNNLESEDIDKILPVLNSSIYVTDFTPKDDSVIIHLGFVFELQTKSKMELFFDIKTDSIIRQKRDYAKIPQLLGLVAIFNSNYLNTFTPLVITSYLTKDQILFAEWPDYKTANPETTANEIELVSEDRKKKIKYTHFEIPDLTKKNTVDGFSITRTLRKRVFFDGNTFKRFISDVEYGSDEDNYL